VSTEASIFDEYAAWYNAFNSGKDYPAETRYVLERIRPWSPVPAHWLDVGCGTGQHVAFLHAQGIDAEGLDASPSMVAQARLAHPGLRFHLGNAQDFQLPARWDVISMLFHVMSYLTSDEQIRGAIDRIGAHLNPEGIFVFDYWHTAGVLNDPPAARVRESRIGGRRMYRISHPSENREERRVDIRFEFRWDAPNGPCVHEEHHSMRHFAPAELAGFLARSGFEVVSNQGWMKRSEPGAGDWYGLICARLQ
jgi:SAM-dependent methyltransferase